ncbi:lysophospholipid acyltransferase family protein [Herbaspirillum sp. CF444]|uniref:lysophospholipid acyltransferase family protein n=1 Tax=Herbaspirillum sp. CF444 TaxID=1144319 RepID=UPI000556D281|nr:lysophospholipid acyltransferase family protein [Herbaspirillum sp. CF444]
MLPFRILRMVAHLFLGMAICAFIFPWIGAARREGHIRRWSGKLLTICGIRVVIRRPDGVTAPPRSLIVANHISWLDIFVVNSMQPCRFVAKSDIRSWPFIGWLCAKTGTIFISRGKASDVRRIFKGLVESIEAGDRVAFFPEGTTAAQGKLLPFHANLFEAALDARVPVQPYALRYLDAQGNYHPAADFIGDTTIVESILAILHARSMTAELTQLPAIPTDGAHRRELAVTARKVVADGLGYVPEDLMQTAPRAGIPPGTAPDPQAVSQ